MLGAHQFLHALVDLLQVPDQAGSGDAARSGTHGPILCTCPTPGSRPCSKQC